MSYCVHEDLKNAEAVMIHLKTCGHYTNRGPTTTTEWYSVNNYKKADITAINEAHV